MGRTCEFMETYLERNTSAFSNTHVTQEATNEIVVRVCFADSRTGRRGPRRSLAAQLSVPKPEKGLNPRQYRNSGLLHKGGAVLQRPTFQGVSINARSMKPVWTIAQSGLKWDLSLKIGVPSASAQRQWPSLQSWS